MERFKILDRELDQRSLDGITVTLMWIPGTKDTYVTVHDSKREDYFSVDVPSPDRVKHVFDHPFSYPRSLGHTAIEGGGDGA